MTRSILTGAPKNEPITMGLDIGSTAVKVVVSKRTADRMAIRHTGAFSVSAEYFDDGVITNPKAVGKLIRDWAKKNGVDSVPTVFSIPNGTAALRWVALPPVQGEERRGAAKFKVRRHLPFPVDDAYIEATHNEESTDEQTKQSLVIAVPKAVVDSRAEAIAYAGFRAVAAELEAQAVLRVIDRRLNERSPLWRNASLTIIDVGGRNTHMYVVQNQSLQFIRSVKFGSNLVANALVESLDVSLAQARDHLLDPNTFLRADGSIVIETGNIIAVANIKSELDKLVNEFLRLLHYFRSQHPERSYAGILDHLVLCGGLVGLRGFADYLGSNLGLRVETARPFNGFMAEVDAEGFQEVTHRQEAYAVAVGLALSAMDRNNELAGGGRIENQFHWQRHA